MSQKLGWLGLVGSRFANQRFIFTLVTLAVCGAKGTHLHNNRFSIAPKRMLLFFFSFFTQDILLLIFIRLLLSHWLPTAQGKLRCFVTTLTSLLIFYNIALGFLSITFYIVAGAEIHWRNIGFIADPSARAIILSGFMTLIGVVSLAVVFSGLLQCACYALFGVGADLANWPLVFVGRKIGLNKSPQISYSPLPQREESAKRFNKYDKDSSFGGYFGNSEKSSLLLPSSQRSSTGSFLRGCSVRSSRCRSVLQTLPYIVVSILLTALFTLTLLRPKDSSLIFLSWTSGLLPFVDFTSTSPFLDDLPGYFETGIQRSWDNHSALAEPIPFNWLPKDTPLAGFEDWYMNETHYSAAADPLRVSNLDEPVLRALRGKLKDISVRHVMLFVLESTRNDVFPIKKNGIIWERFANTFPGKELPREVQETLAKLTPTANFITGDYDDGFEHEKEEKRGGIRFTNAYTAATYTLKSLVGTVCGVAPLVGDFNLEHSHHIYQPCLPHVLEAMNKVEEVERERDERSSWRSYFFQAATIDYDNQKRLMSKMGFPTENTIDREYLRSPAAKHGAVTLPNINEFAFEEDPLEDYIRDIFADATENNDRVFLTHLTSTSHHRFYMPKKEKYVKMANGLDMMSRYINTEGYSDRWIRKVLNVLDEQGVANDTLIIFLGDHGVSLPENDLASPYYNPNIGVGHIPLILSHPQLPAFNAHDAVQSSQVLPTILDILLETGSLTDASRQVATDLIHNYEGQSLLRRLSPVDLQTGQGQWQFTITNPGRALLTVRDTRFPERRLVVPVIENVAWRYSNLDSDPHEMNSVQNFDFVSFLQGVEELHGRNVARWAEEGAFITRWFVKENSKRWRFDHGG